MTDKIDPKFKELIISKIPSNRLGHQMMLQMLLLFCLQILII